MVFLRVIALIASFAFVLAGAMPASKAQTADLSTGIAGSIKLAASGEREGSCCPPLSCKNVKFCRKDEGKEEVEGCCYTKNKQGHFVCSCKKICSSCK